jgi:exosortase A
MLAIVAVYWDTFASLVAIWQRSETFAHCFLIVPICLYLIWRKRGELARVELRVSVLGMLAVAALSVGWLVARSADVQVGMQLAAVLLLPATVVALVGTDAARTIAFPLLYLVFAVPFGEALLLPLMEFTASFTVQALRLTGIPVLREGLYFSIPSGDFEVAKACSGLRYLIACAALGLLYSYVSYRSWRKRAAFIAVSLVAPIIANGVRAYLIVMIAHLSDMKLATGVDHLIYGWLFFGGLVFLLFWIGSYFQDPPAADSAARPPLRGGRSGRPAAFVGTAVVVAVFAALGPYWSATVQARAAALPSATARLPILAHGWQGPDNTVRAWAPASAGEPALRGRYSGATGGVDLEVITADQAQGVEIVGYIARSLDASRAQILEAPRAVAAGEAAVMETVLRTSDAELVLWHWYRVGGSSVAADWRAKALEAWSELADGGGEVTLVVLAARNPDREVARETLREFAADALGPIEACLAQASSECAHAR